MLSNMHESTKQVVDMASTVTVVGTIMNWLPAAAALWTIVWTSIRIYETKTVQDWLKARKNAKQI
jgi:argonaute-like protein implicated in RNA metabolism and viral defense